MAKRGTKKRKSTQTKPDPTAAELRALIQAAIDAKDRGNDAAREAALVALVDFQARPVSAELRQIAAEARSAAATDDIDAGLGRLKEIAARMGTAGPALDAATAIAVQGAKKLLFPKVAKSAESMLAAVQELKKAADELKGQVANARELGDLPTLLANVQALLEKLKARANSLQG